MEQFLLLVLMPPEVVFMLGFLAQARLLTCYDQKPNKPIKMVKLCMVSKEKSRGNERYHCTGNLYSQSIIFQELISYAATVPEFSRIICLYSYSSFLLVDYLLCTGCPFTGTRTPFPQLLSLLLSHCVLPFFEPLASPPELASKAASNPWEK